MKKDKLQVSARLLVFNLLIVSCFLFSAFIIYWVTAQKAQRLKSDLLNITGQVSQIESFAGSGENFQDGIKVLQEKYKNIDSKFPAREEEGLRLLWDLARKQNIKVVAIRSQSKVPLLDQDQQKIEIEGKILQKLSITMQLKSSYQDVVTYLEQLKQSSTTYFTVEGLHMNKSPSVNDSGLDVTMDINFYLLS